MVASRLGAIMSGHPSDAQDTVFLNFLAAQVLVASDLNIPVWRRLLVDYTALGLLDCLEFGFPSNYSAPLLPPMSTYPNHRCDPGHTHFISDYITEELGRGVLLSPFPVPPFSTWDQCHHKADLSFPQGPQLQEGLHPPLRCQP